MKLCKYFYIVNLPYNILYLNDQNKMVNVYYPILNNYSILKINGLRMCLLCNIETSNTLPTWPTTLLLSESRSSWKTIIKSINEHPEVFRF